MVRERVFLIFVLLFISCETKKVTTTGTIEESRNCPDRVAKHPNFFTEYNHLKNVTYLKIKYRQYVNGLFYINKEVRKLPTTVILKRFNSKNDLNGENLMNMKFNDVCPMFLDKGQPYSPFLETAVPPIVCPLPKNAVYEFRNSTLDVSTAIKYFSFLPNLYNSLWGIRFEGRMNNVEMWCMEVLFRFFEVKN